MISELFSPEPMPSFDNISGVDISVHKYVITEIKLKRFAEFLKPELSLP